MSTMGLGDGWIDMAEEETVKELLARIDQRLSVIDTMREDHEGRLRQIERSAIQNAFVTSGISQTFWILVAAVMGFVVSHFGSK